MGNLALLFKYIGPVLLILPYVVKLVKAFEIPGNGAEKKALVIAMLKEAYPTLQGLIKELQALPWAVIEGVLDKLIDFVVDSFNTLGIFKKQEPVPAM